ncbi:MAG: Cobaltochelatase CobN [Methanomicrobiales archaeon 53_19]|uniref:cobaltochelatase subunit CobN n=1 Tax=Methanocalculus sp. TaxID=2004547 RepID=UPI000746C3E2|nr:cobaltochelatase subunit CobN [Methanocalculus sp.]KUL01596.1 MAG: Cobaltochelatase CobN [Methanomicrobiales archaeon 53_19]HIJ06448.1 cobaltochelatase subunit CobN [Methanocalculus sp.]
MKIAAIVWGSDIPLLDAAARREGVHIDITGVHNVDDQKVQDRFLRSQEDADLILLHPSHDAAWDDLIPRLRTDIPIVSFGHNQDFWSLSTIPIRSVAAVSAYMTHGGEENYCRMIRFLRKIAEGEDAEPETPLPMPWEGIYHPDSPEPFSDRNAYYSNHPRRHNQSVGIIFSRTYWANGDHGIVDALIRRIEQFADVIPIFCLSGGDVDLGARPGPVVAREIFSDEVSLIVNLQPVFRSSNSEASGDIFSDLNIPVMHPILLYHKTRQEWLDSALGPSAMEIGWSIALPEMQGMIEMLAVGTEIDSGEETGMHEPIPDRIERICRRAEAWLKLQAKSPKERKVAFILHNKPCSSVEATVGAGAHLDTLESVARIMQVMKQEGYTVDPPSSGKELIDQIMEKRAISDFRWTSVGSIVRCGGALDLVNEKTYREWFSELEPSVQKRLEESWGKPPGEEMDGVPAAMVHDGKIVVTGVSYGNAVVCVQPKRGCAGARCDGEACRILHDPEIPPTHQYLATYRWLERVFGADVIVHVGTHGNLEFLPGKSAAPSNRCFPDIAIGTIPHLYIYNADNPPEGTIAKRRACATLVNHMQTVMQASGLYGALKDLEKLLEEYTRAQESDPARAHTLEHLIIDSVEEGGIGEETDLKSFREGTSDFTAFVERIHRHLGMIASSRIPDGMHIFGERPEGEARVQFIQAAARFDDALTSALFGEEILPDNPGSLHEREEAELSFIRSILADIPMEEAVVEACGRPPLPGTEEKLVEMIDLITMIDAGIESSDEIGSLLNGFSGGFIPPGPSGLITRGKPDILPTGRNFYSLDPQTVPTKAAWMVGKKLADALLTAYMDEHGRYPESVAMYWLSTDLMWADGEQFAQILHLIGVEPVWRGSKVVSFEIIPLSELGRPRVDVTIRASGILRDCFFCSIELLDKAIAMVAGLDETDEDNPIKAHTQESGTAKRIFSSRPGTYGNGVNLAVYASAWKEEKDLAEIFLEWNSFSYGDGDSGTENRDGFSNLLSHVDATFNKTATDEYDLTGCCCYFGTHGGMTAAARHLSGRHVEAYYGDTRTPSKVEVRTLAAELRRVVTTKLLNPVWIEGMKRHGYKGAGDIAKRVGTVYGWEASTGEVDDRIFDEIAKTFVLDPDNRAFFKEENPFALEEIGRRLLEAESRGLWNPDPEISEGLREAYLETEGWLEDRLDSRDGTVQGGAIDIMTVGELRARHNNKM